MHAARARRSPSVPRTAATRARRASSSARGATRAVRCRRRPTRVQGTPAAGAGGLGGVEPGLAFGLSAIFGSRRDGAPRRRPRGGAKSGTGGDPARPTTRRSTHMATEQSARAEGQEAPDGPVSDHLTRSDRVELMRYMLLMRGIEERAMNLYR